MDFSVLEKSTLFSGVPTKELRDDLEAVPHHIQCYDKGETVFHLMEDANRIGVILEGRILCSHARDSNCCALPLFYPHFIKKCQAAFIAARRYTIQSL